VTALVCIVSVDGENHGVRKFSGFMDDRPPIPHLVSNLFKKETTKNTIMQQHEDINYTEHIQWTPSTIDTLHIPLSLIWRHCYVHHPVQQKISALPKDVADVRLSAWNRQFAFTDPHNITQVVNTGHWGTSTFQFTENKFLQWKNKFIHQFGVDPTTLDVHNYTSPTAEVPLRVLYDECYDSSIPFYHPWLMVDEADVLLVMPDKPNTIIERIQSNCPHPSHTNIACLIFIRSAQLYHEDRIWVLDTLLTTMQKRKQKFVLVTAWQEIWCTPYSIYPIDMKRARPSLSQAAVNAINRVLESPLLVKWFGKNICGDHPKLEALPLGAKETPNGIRVWERMFKSHLWFYLGGHRASYLFMEGSKSKTKFLSDPIFEILNTNSPAYTPYRNLRKSLFDHTLKHFPVPPLKNTTMPNIKYPIIQKYDAISYFEELRSAKFGLAPTGAAIDSHRAWETLLLGTIPIVHDTTLNSLFDGLPVVILKDNKLVDLTPGVLMKRYRAIVAKGGGVYDWEKLYAFYWLKKVRMATYLN